MGSSKKQTIGYQYFLSLHAILSHAKLDAITAIKFDGKLAWSGWWTEGEITVNAPSLFGGQEREGGVSGTIELMPGEPTQGQNSFLLSRLGSLLPGFRGVAGLLFKNFYWGNNPYFKLWSVRAQRIHFRQDGEEQWYNEKAAVPNPSSPIVSRTYTDFVTGFETNDADKFTIIDGAIANVDNVAATDNSSYYGIDLGNFLPVKMYCEFQVISAGDGDPLAVALQIANPDLTDHTTSLNPRTETGPDPLARPSANYFSDAAGGQRVYTSALDVGVWYNYETELDYQSATQDYTLRLGDTVLQTGTLPIIAQAPRRLAFQRSHNPPGTVSVAAFRKVILEGQIGSNDMNPAHIIRECLTDSMWGMGYSEADVDDVSFMAAADKLFAEGMGMSLLWDRQIPLEDFIAEVLRHIDAALYVSSKGATAGKFVLKLIRLDYDIEDLPVIGPDEVIRVENWKQTMPAEMANSITVNYWDPARGDTNSVTLSDPALIIEQGAIINTTQRYEGFTNGSLAAQVAERDLNVLSRPLYVGTIICQWDPAADFEIGTAFVFNFPELNVYGVVLRVSGLTRGDGKNHNVRLSVSQDVYALPALPMIVPPETEWEDPQQPPTAANNRVAFELPYRELVQQVGQATADDTLATTPEAGFVAAAAGRPGTAINAKMMVDSGAGYEQSNILEFCPTAKLDAAIDKLDETVNITDGVELDLVTPGTYAILGSEFIIVDSIVGNVLNFRRGTLDTVPEAHAAGDVIYFCDEDYATSQTQYVLGEELGVKVLPVSGSETLPLNGAEEDLVEMSQRALRPYPPGDFKLNGFSYPDDTTGDVAVTWTHRDRLLQADQLIDTTEGDIGPEPGTTYNLRLFLDSVLVEDLSGITDNFYTFVDPTAGVAVIELESERDGLVSWQMHSHQFILDTPPTDPDFASVVALLHFDGADASTTFTDVIGKTWTPAGNAQLDTAQFKFGSASGLFDGAGDYISTASSTDFDFSSSGDFTVEFWLRLTDKDNSDGNSVFCVGNSSGYFQLLVRSNVIQVNIRNSTGGSFSDLIAAQTLVNNTWVHIAWTREGSTYRIFYDGNLKSTTGSLPSTFTCGTYAAYIGSNYNGGTSSLAGHIDDLRITKGVARYTASFTPPATPFPNSA